MDVFWLEQSVADLPKHNDWLNLSEIDSLNGMRFEKRRADWRLGRWTAKRALAAHLNFPAYLQALTEIEIRPASSGAPEVYIANKPAEISISLSHSAGIAICAIAASGAALGCDLEIVEPRSDDFVADYFTAEEQELIGRAHEADRPQLVTLLWSGKESALKALHEGLRLDTRSVVVTPAAVQGRCNEKDQLAKDRAFTFEPSDGSCRWYPLHVRFGDQTFYGWWQHANKVMRTMVATPSPSQPISLMDAVSIRPGQLRCPPS